MSDRDTSRNDTETRINLAMREIGYAEEALREACNAKARADDCVHDRDNPAAFGEAMQDFYSHLRRARDCFARAESLAWLPYGGAYGSIAKPIPKSERN